MSPQIANSNLVGSGLSSESADGTDVDMTALWVAHGRPYSSIIATVHQITVYQNFRQHQAAPSETWPPAASSTETEAAMASCFHMLHDIHMYIYIYIYVCMYVESPSIWLSWLSISISKKKQISKFGHITWQSSACINRSLFHYLPYCPWLLPNRFANHSRL